MDQKQTSENLSQFLTSIGYIAIPFLENLAGQLLINVKINDVDGVYILDTGASQTVVDTKQFEKLKLKLNHEETSLTGGGVGAHSLENVPSYNNKIEINGFKIDDQLIAVMSLATAWEALALAGAHDEIFGIIGVDILKAGNAVIDFSSMTVYLKQPEL